MKEISPSSQEFDNHYIINTEAARRRDEEGKLLPLEPTPVPRVDYSKLHVRDTTKYFPPVAEVVNITDGNIQLSLF